MDSRSGERGAIGAMKALSARRVVCAPDKLRVVELYAGIGRCSAPFSGWRRTRVSLLADWSEHAADVHRINHPSRPYWVTDLTSVSNCELQRAAGGSIDVVLGCPPCQGFSDGGKRDRNDPRNDHITNFMRLAVGAMPQAIAMENVPMAALSPHFQCATLMLERAGYRWTAGVMNAAEYGSAQTRSRLVLLALRGDLHIDPALPRPTHGLSGSYFDYASGCARLLNGPDDHLLGVTSSARRAAAHLATRYGRAGRLQRTPTFREATAGLPSLGSLAARFLSHSRWPHTQAVLQRMGSVAEGGQLATDRTYYASAYARLHRQGLARTLTTYFPNAGSGRFWHPTDNRAISVREAARLQGIDDSFQFPGGAIPANAILLGNALDMHLSRSTYQAVRDFLD